MNNKLPKVYINNQNKKIYNNKETFYGRNTNNTYNNNSKNINNELLIKEKINEIFSSPNFIYKIKVLIKTDEWEREIILIAKTNTSLLTIENNVIPISIIKDINVIN